MTMAGQTEDSSMVRSMPAASWALSESLSCDASRPRSRPLIDMLVPSSRWTMASSSAPRMPTMAITRNTAVSSSEAAPAMAGAQRKPPRCSQYSRLSRVAKRRGGVTRSCVAGSGLAMAFISVGPFHRGHEQVGQAGRAGLAMGGERVAVGAVEQHHRLPEGQGALVARPRRTRGLGVARIDQRLGEAPGQLVHRRVDHDPAVADEQRVGEDVLHLFHLVGGDDDGLGLVEVILQQPLVELLAIE